MDPTSSIVPLTCLSPGIFEYDVVVKVDRIVCKEVVRFPLGPSRPMRELIAIQLVIFDETLARMLLVIDDRTVMARFAQMFVEQRTYKIRDFMVRINHDPKHVKYHIRLLHSSIVETIEKFLPEHAWDLITVPHVTTGVAVGRGLIDVCGFLVSVYENGMGENCGTYCRQVTVVLEDNGVLSVGETKVLGCIMKGECAETTLREYNAKPLLDPVFVVIQYALVTVTPQGASIVTSYFNATRVFFNPEFPELQQQRMDMLGRTNPVESPSSVPIL